MAGGVRSDERAKEGSEPGGLRPGARLGRYELLVPIAMGGMARVWAARHNGQRGFQKLVAIKTILPHLAFDPEFERMFLDEARIASHVHHPNVCEIYELGEEKRTLYLAMEWASGDSLSRVLRPNPNGTTEAIDARVAARLIADACAGVHAAHELTDDDGHPLGVVHRDLSPHNVLLTLDGVAKVCDFGVAKAFGQLHEATSAGQLKGKLGYMAPEQLAVGAIDRRSDVYTLGCVLYEATTGLRPFRGDQDHDVMRAVMRGDVPPPSRHFRSYPQELERIVLRALARDPVHRFPSAELMRFALEEFLARGQLVTHAHVAQVVRSRVGDQIDRRRDSIRQASGLVEERVEEPSAADADREREDDPESKTVMLAAASPEPAPPEPAGAQRGRLPSFVELGEGRGGGGETVVMHSPALGVFGPPTPPRLPAPASNLRGAPVARAVPIPIATPQLASGGGSGSRTEGPIYYAAAAAIGVFAALVIGIVGFLVWSSREDPRTGPGVASAASAKSSAPATPAGVAARATPEIAIRLTPAEAVLVVDGLELDAAQRSLARPPVGQMRTVVVRAKGHSDVTMMVDYFTVTPLEIVLKPATAASPPPNAAGAGTTGAAGESTTGIASAAPATSGSAVRPAARPVGDLPQNPY